MARVFIVLATYNGAKFLPALLDSVRAQSLSDWVVLARDDGSSDATNDILMRAAASDSRIEVVCDERGRLGCAGNFGVLCERALLDGAEYVALCDQDDVWHEDKLERQLATLRALEDQYAGRAAAVYAALRLIDGAGRLMPGDYFTRAGVDPVKHRNHAWLLTHNVIPGCALLCNAALLRIALPVPAEAVMHDWWFLLCAYMAGHLRGDPLAALDYRVHDANTVGQLHWRERVTRLGGIRESMEWLRYRNHELVAQLETLASRVSQCAEPEPLRLLHFTADALQGHGGWMRWSLPVGMARRLGWMRNVVLWLQLFIATLTRK